MTLIDEIYKKAIDTYGVDMQLTVATEELSELAKELCKYKRGIGDIDHIAEELADVRIMCQQLCMIFDIKERVLDWEAHKLARLKYNLGL